MSDKSFIDEAKELFGEMRPLTLDEQQAYQKGIASISTPTGRNIFEDYQRMANEEIINAFKIPCRILNSRCGDEET